LNGFETDIGKIKLAYKVFYGGVCVGLDKSCIISDTLPSSVFGGSCYYLSMLLDVLLKDFANSTEFVSSSSLATRAVYTGALRALLKDHLAQDAGWFTRPRLEAALQHFDAVYSPARASQARSAYRKLRDWAQEWYGVNLPPLKRGRPGRKTAQLPPEEVIRAADRLLSSVPHGVLSHTRLLSLRWEQLKVEAMRGEQCVMLPGRKPGIYFSVPVTSEGGAAITALWKYSGGNSGPLLPAEKGSQRPLALAQFRKGLSQIHNVGVGAGDGLGDDGREASVVRNLDSLRALDSES
jgi:hypothetical protein